MVALVGWVVAYSHGDGDGALSGSREERKREPEEGENEGRLWASPWRREDVGEAATAKQEVEARARRVDTPLPVGRD